MQDSSYKEELSHQLMFLDRCLSTWSEDTYMGHKTMVLHIDSFSSHNFH